MSDDEINFAEGMVVADKCSCTGGEHPGGPRYLIESIWPELATRQVGLRNLATGRRHRTSLARLSSTYLPTAERPQ